MNAFNNVSESNITSYTIDYISLGMFGWIFSLLVVLPENVYVIWLSVTEERNGVASEFFSLNVSVCEMLLCLQCFFSVLSSTSQIFLLFVVFLKGVIMTGRPLFQCLICVERYLAVVHPVTFLKYKPLRYKVICSTVAWIIILIYCVFLLNAVLGYWFICLCLCQGLFMLSVKLLCCLAVLKALKQSGPGDRKREGENQMKRKAFHIILLITMAIVFIYAAYSVAAFIYILTNQFISGLWIAGDVCFWLGGLVQPLLYLHRTGKLPFLKLHRAPKGFFKKK